MATTTQMTAETSGTDITRFNALRHGVLSRYTVLPWEDADEYQSIVTALVAHHVPCGPTEEHLVEEIAGIIWRKRRLRLAEAAAHRRSLEGPWWAETLARDPEETDEDKKPGTTDVEGLRRFLAGEVLPVFDNRMKELADRAFGELLDPDKLERLGRYEVHLDRKLERMLAMLLRLQAVRSGMY
jgi:hypothetical protein